MLTEWVGVDGCHNSSLIQAGVTEIPDPGTPEGFDLYAWWEVLPAANQPITTVTVSPGDEVSVAIGQVSGTSWEIPPDRRHERPELRPGRELHRPGHLGRMDREAPTDSQTRQQLLLAPYTPAVDFSGFSATGESTSVSEVVMAQENQQVSTPCPLTPAGFTVAYGPTAPSVPGGSNGSAQEAQRASRMIS